MMLSLKSVTKSHPVVFTRLFIKLLFLLINIIKELDEAVM
jgi:hypothetical protein